MSGKDYARLVSMKYRSQRATPRINRPIRPRVIAWAGPAAFYPNRFYEIDRWYKARIDKPDFLPKLHIIDPAKFQRSIYEITQKEPAQLIDIGFAQKSEAQTHKLADEKRSELEKKAHWGELFIDLSNADSQDLSIHHHYKIFDDLFGAQTFFHSVQGMEVVFDDIGMYHGNIITAESMKNAPRIKIEAVGSKGYSTLLFVNLDGNAFEGIDGEIIHWLVSDIPDGQELSSGKEVVPYLQPVPFCGTGYHRIAAVVLRHKKPLEFNFQLNSSLTGRILKVADFYKAVEDQATPSAIRFAQTSYDISCKKVLHEIGLKSPIFAYDPDEPLKPEQREYPRKPMPFDLYLDMYRDPKEVEEEILEERLQRAQLDDYKAPKWLDINYNENKRNMAPWLHNRMLARKGRFSALYDNVIRE